MKKLIPLLLLLLTCFSGRAANTSRTTVDVTVTNVPVTGNSFAVNSTVRIWTNANSSTTILTNLAGVGPSTTNLANNLGSFPLTGPFAFQWIATNRFRLVGPLGGTVSASSTGNWATITVTATPSPETFDFKWPIENMGGDQTNKTNQASSTVSGLSTYSTNALATNSTVLANAVQKGAGPLQIVTAPLQINQLSGTNVGLSGGTYSNGSFRGTVVALTNGYWTNGVLDSPLMTNGVNNGNAFRSPGTGSGSEQFGSGASATGAQSLAIGASAAALGDNDIAIGNAAAAGTNTGNVVIGSGATARYTPSSRHGANSIVLGTSARASVTNGIAIGSSTVVDFENSTAVGSGVIATAINQAIFGGVSQNVGFGGPVLNAVETNTTWRGSNTFNGDISWTPGTLTSLVNGYNGNLALPAFNTYIRLSGHTAAITNRGFSAAGIRDGKEINLQFNNPGLMCAFADEDGSENSTNRIRTTTGGIVFSTNNPCCVKFYYDGSISRWVLWSLPKL